MAATNWGKPFRYALSTARGGFEYREWFKATTFPIVDTGHKPAVDIPRPEIWDFVTDPWLHGRSAEVASRMQQQPDYDISYARDNEYAARFRELDRSTEGSRRACATCDLVPVSVGELLDRVTSGRFSVIRADSEFERMLESGVGDPSASSVAFVKCHDSDETIFWGPGQDGRSVYEHVHAWAPFTWVWSEGVPWIDNCPSSPPRPDSRSTPQGVRRLISGTNFTIEALGSSSLRYSERRRRWSVPLAVRDGALAALVPRPEFWDEVVPEWLRGRSRDVTRRIQTQATYPAFYGPDDEYADLVRARDDETESTHTPCDVCDAAVVAPRVPSRIKPSETVLDLLATDAAVRARVADGRFELIRGDGPVDGMLDLLEADLAWSIVAFLRCTASNETIFWGLSRNGSPIYKHVKASGPFTWPWNDGHAAIDTAPAGPPPFTVSDANRQLPFNVVGLRTRIHRVGVDPFNFGIGSYADDRLCIMQTPDERWEVFIGQRGQKDELVTFDNEADACLHFLGRVAWTDWQ